MAEGHPHTPPLRFLRDGSVSPKMTHWRALGGEGSWEAGKGGADANPEVSEEW